ncbi:hydroxyethylthiazole kinase-like uncharacterized protein yjeF/hydroxyethylthiazole kinase-like uncharacterized protein yjeF [Novosphingobium kunmingense]|uniref:Bifunctional NAD(P)H-hydrate repair enzyme n=1 Tax=Novosphingobium kunmingense TaxID=1211806 RepID=A0A2N0I142_9SPHN|nr:NAD(P)H-hydrate dehydratase [Novosphingobium kunmingense]PKB24910.1 hydroxyethylthiazole kinase-like uncharacterized protein yjeF/hydroxyethylthiazole kinase-like uncharacterized protein yjeF [Novosphingobium kunmingense]
MPRRADPVLTAGAMRAAEKALIAAGTSVDELMRRAGQGAADYVWRMTAGRPVTVLCGPGNNGGDGYVIAGAIRARGGDVAVVAAAPPATDAARNARTAYTGEVRDPGDDRHGDVLVDCLFGTGLTRPLEEGHLALLQRLASAHALRVAIDLPSGIDSDTGKELNDGLPRNDLTVALGAWKPAHFLMPAAAKMGALRLVGIGVEASDARARRLSRPVLAAPGAGAHKYTRGLLGVVGGGMPGAALLAAQAAQHAGAGYIRMLSDQAAGAPADLVVDPAPLSDALSDKRLSAVLVGPGLGRQAAAVERLALSLAIARPAVVDADALMLLTPRLVAERTAPLIVTPHEGEAKALEQAFGLIGTGSKPERALELATVLRAVVIAKGPDTVIAAPDGRLAFAPPATPWLSTAGTGDVLSGIVASRLAVGTEPFEAACQGVWLHGEAARLAGKAFAAGQLAECVQAAYAACL